MISAEGVSTDPEKVKAVQQWPVPLKVTDVRSFLELASYYRRFIQNFAEIAAQQSGPNQAPSLAPKTPVRRPHVPPPYVPDETELMYMDEATNEEVAVPERPSQSQEPHAAVNDPPAHANRPRCEVRDASMDARLCILISRFLS